VSVPRAARPRPAAPPSAPDAPPAPADPTPPPAPPELPAEPRVFHRAADGTVRTDLDAAEVAVIVRAGEGALWVDVDVRSATQHAWLERVFHFHPLAIEDTLNPHSRVKHDEYPGYLFTIIRGVRFDETTVDPYDLATSNLCFFLGAHFLVTVHRTDASVCHEVAARVEANPDVLGWGLGRLMHALMDLSVDRYFPILDRLDDFVDEIEDRVFLQEDATAMREIFSVKRLVLDLRRHLGPQREVLNALTNRPSPLLPPEVQVYYRDVYDHVLRITESLDTYRDLLSSTLDSSLSQTSNRLATVTKTLSVLATLSIPFVMLSGMWGMNFARIPLSDEPYGFWLLLLVQLGLGALVVLFLRWRRLL
jgi:magnesium transporter